MFKFKTIKELETLENELKEYIIEKKKELSSNTTTNILKSKDFKELIDLTTEINTGTEFTVDLSLTINPNINLLDSFYNSWEFIAEDCSHMVRSEVVTSLVDSFYLSDNILNKALKDKEVILIKKLTRFAILIDKVSKEFGISKKELKLLVRDSNYTVWSDLIS